VSYTYMRLNVKPTPRKATFSDCPIAVARIYSYYNLQPHPSPIYTLSLLYILVSLALFPELGQKQRDQRDDDLATDQVDERQHPRVFYRSRPVCRSRLRLSTLNCFGGEQVHDVFHRLRFLRLQCHQRKSVRERKARSSPLSALASDPRRSALDRRPLLSSEVSCVRSPTWRSATIVPKAALCSGKILMGEHAIRRGATHSISPPSSSRLIFPLPLSLLPPNELPT
jgi:hypothetical protein